MNIWLSILLIIVVGAGCGIAGWYIGKKQGSKEKEEYILREMVSYVPLKELPDLAEELLEKNMSPTFPLMIFNPNKYDYINSTNPE